MTDKKMGKGNSGRKMLGQKNGTGVEAERWGTGGKVFGTEGNEENEEGLKDRKILNRRERRERRGNWISVFSVSSCEILV